MSTSSSNPAWPLLAPSASFRFLLTFLLWCLRHRYVTHPPLPFPFTSSSSSSSLPVRLLLDTSSSSLTRPPLPPTRPGLYYYPLCVYSICANITVSTSTAQVYRSSSSSSSSLCVRLLLNTFSSSSSNPA